MTSETRTEQELANHESDLTARLRARLAMRDGELVAGWLRELPPGDMVRAISHLSPEEQGYLLRLLDPEDAADVLDDLPDEHSADLLEEMATDEAAAIIEELDSDDRADVLSEMEFEDVEAILEALPQEEAKEARELLAYRGDTAGGVMVKEYVVYTVGTTVGEVLDDLRANREEYSHYDVRYFYVTDKSGVLKGVLRLRDLVLSPRARPIDEVMIRNPTGVHVDLDLSTLQQMFEAHTYSALPVVDERGRLLGVVLEKEVGEAARKYASRTMLKLAGIFGGEELRSMPTLSRAGHRLAWLVVILGLSVCAASVIALHTHTLHETIALAVFLPVVAGMSGSSANQAVGVSLRELALGVVKPRDILYVVFREMRVAIIVGIALGVLIGFLGGLWQYPRFGLVIGLALGTNAMVMVCLGGLVPLLLKRLNVDPAMASSPIVNMIADTGGFFLVLSLAGLLLRGVA